MSKFKLFIENFLVYGLGSVISKIIPLIMLPIITRLMPNESYYGLNDISSTVISFGAAIAIMGIYDAMFRVFFEKDTIEYKKEVCSSALVAVIISSLIIFTILLIFKEDFSAIFFGSKEYSLLINICAFSILLTPISLILAAPTRMQNRRKVYLVTNTLSPIIAYSISIPMLLNEEYVKALPLATLIASLCISVIFLMLNYKWFNIRLVNLKLIKDMLWIGLPLVPNFLIYWIFNSADRLMISNMVGSSQVGLYGVAARIGSISQLIYTAFSSGWQYFAYSTMKDKNQVEINSKIFEWMGIISFIATCGLATVSYTLFNIFFTGNYVGAYIIVPYLFLSPLLLMLFQIASSQLLIVKKSWISSLILFIGAIVNIVFNFILIKFIGYEGAAIATVIAYIVIVVLSILILNKMSLLNISKKFYISFMIMVVFLISWTSIFNKSLLNSSLVFILIIITYMWIYKEDLDLILKNIIRRKKN